MDKTVRKYTSFEETKADEYHYSQSRPVWERMDAVWELTKALYELKHGAPVAERFERTLVRFERVQR